MELILKELIKAGKNQHREFLSYLENPIKIAQLMCSFSNSDGGSLFIGVRENGKISGINPSEEIEKATEYSLNLCQPKIAFETKIWQEDFRLVLEIKIHANLEKNSLAKDENNEWRKFVRLNQHTVKETKILEKIGVLEKKNSSKPEMLSENELEFLSLFKNDLKFTLSQIYTNSKLKKSEIDDLTAKFTYWKTLEMEFSHKGTLYKLKN